MYPNPHQQSCRLRRDIETLLNDFTPHSPVCSLHAFYAPPTPVHGINGGPLHASSLAIAMGSLLDKFPRRGAGLSSGGLPGPARDAVRDPFSWGSPSALLDNLASHRLLAPPHHWHLWRDACLRTDSPLMNSRSAGRGR